MASPDASAARATGGFALLEQDEQRRPEIKEPPLALSVAHAVKRALDGGGDELTSRHSKRAWGENHHDNDPRQRTRRVMARRLEIAHDQHARLASFLAQRLAATEIQRMTQAEATSTICAICLGELRQDAIHRDTQAEALACGHVYHRRCIARWVGYNRCCPIDRRPLD